MQIVKEIIREIGLPIWICWGATGAFLALISIVAILNRDDTKHWSMVIPLQGTIIFLVTVGIIFYCANDSLQRRKTWDKEMARHKGELAAIQSKPILEEKKSISLDYRLQNIEGIIGYLDQSIKMEYQPKDLIPIILQLAKEIKSIKDKE